MILIEKSKRCLHLTDETGAVKMSCPISLGSCPQGHKLSEGDGRTPEGVYRICSLNPESKFHFAFGISYPSGEDARRAKRDGRISALTSLRIRLCSFLGIRPPWNTCLGGYIMLHGESPEGLNGDWTAGCIAVGNDHIDALRKHIKKGDRIIIRP